MNELSEWQQLGVLMLIAAGCFCVGGRWGRRQVLYWRIKWIELEHETARALGREPRDIEEVE